MSKRNNQKIIDGTCKIIDEGKPEGGENVNQEQKENKAPEQEQKNQEAKDTDQQSQKPANDEEVGFFKKHKKKFIVAGAGLLIAGLSFWFGNWTGSRGSDDDGDHYLPFPEDDDEEPEDSEDTEE